MMATSDGNVYDDAIDNVYDDLPGASHLLKEEDEVVEFDIPTAGACAFPSAPPPPLLPKKGNSFRQSYAILDRRQSNEPPKPVPRLRKPSLDPLTDGQTDDTPLGASSRISRSCEFSPPILIGAENPLSEALKGRGTSLSTLASSMSFNEGVTSPSDNTVKKPVVKVNSLGSPVHRPVPVPRTRTVFKKKDSETDIKVDVKDDKPTNISEDHQPSSEQKEPIDSLSACFERELDDYSREQNKEIDDLFQIPNQETRHDSLSQTGTVDNIDKPIASNDDENINYEQNVYEDIDKSAEEPANLPSKSPSLPSTPKVPPRPNRIKAPISTSKSEEQDDEAPEHDLSCNTGITDGEASMSKNSDTDFFNFDAFNVSSSPAASNDPWPGVDSTLCSDTGDLQTGNTADFEQRFSETFGDQSEITNIRSDDLSPPVPFSQQGTSSNIPSFDNAFSTSLMASAISQTPPHSNSSAFVNLGDFDPLSGSNDDVNSQEASSNTYSVSTKHNDMRLSTLFLDTKVPLNDIDIASQPTPHSPGSYVDLDRKATAAGGDAYSFAQAPPPPPPKPSKPISHAPSFHFSPPTAPPPPLPRTESELVKESAPPPVPPRPSAIGSLPPRPQAPPRNSRILADLPTPVFSPMGDDTSDPFKDSDFGNECYNFNKTLTLNQQQHTSQSSGFSSTPSPVAAASPGGNRSGFEVPAREPIEAAGASAYPNPRQDPDRISQFVIPAPGSTGSSTSPAGNSNHNMPPSPLDANGDSIYNLAEVIRPRKDLSSSDSEFGDGPMVAGADRPKWTSGGQPVAGLTVMDSGQLAPKKNQRYGYLYKQGGYNANKGWKKRWVVFNGTSLSYYDSNTSQVSKRIIPVACMKEVISDVKTNERHSFKFKVVTTLQDRVFIFSAESLEDCVLWSNFIMAGITEYKKGKRSTPVEDKSDKEGFIKFSNMKKYYVVISGHHLRYFRSFKDFQMGSPIHEIDMKLASVKVKDRKRCRLQLWLNYDHFDLSFENDSEMQSWRMAMEDAIAEGLADDTVLEKVYHNISNRECADCGAEKPHWASINLGIVVCKNCAGIHRMFDYHVSKIRSLRMDTRVWTPSLIELMVTIGNANANAFWEYSLPQDLKLHPMCNVMERKDFIQKKYFNKKFRNHHPLTGMAQALGEELHKISSTDNVLEAMKILFSGADVLFRKDGSEETAYDIAKEVGQRLIMELLYQNCGDPQAVVEDEEDESRIREDIRLQGYLNKTGPAGRTYDKRWCIIEHGALNYYINERSLTSKGSIDRRNMLLIKEVTLDRPGFHFEISTNSRENRVYSFSTDSRDDAGEWMRTIAKLIAPVAVMEHVGMIDIKFSGYAHMRESIGTEWKQSFLVFTWRGLYYMNKDLRLDYIDLRKASSIKMQNADNGYHLAQEKGPCFIICSTGKSLYLQAPLARDTEKMYQALLFAIKGSGRTLIDQALTNDNVPVIVDKCVTHISKLGLEEKGIYRLGAQTSRARTLLEEFREDAGAVVLEGYTVHEVANALKRFLRELEDSVFERINYPQWTSMAASKDVNNRLMWYKYYLEKMPSVNYNTLKRLILHLSQVALYETSNQMTAMNLATCFAPSLLRTEMDVPDLMSDVSSREISIIMDLISYQYYFFEDKENERLINDKIRIAEQQIMQKMQETRDGVNASSSNIERILTPVHMMNAEGPAVNIPVTEDTKAQEALDYFKRSKATSDIDTSSFALFELVAKGVLVRPLFPEELLNPTVKRWLGWEDWVKEDNSVSLCARNTELLEKLDANYNPTHVLLSKLQYCDSKSKKYKRYTVGFKQCRLAVYVNAKAVIEVSSWNVEDITFYIGSMPKKSTPTKYCLTFIVDGEKCSKVVGAFGHSLCFDTEDELYRWAAALYVAQHPGGFLTWNS